VVVGGEVEGVDLRVDDAATRELRHRMHTSVRATEPPVPGTGPA
jgi:hypothetical protein